jgi:hypothetical protein
MRDAAARAGTPFASRPVPDATGVGTHREGGAAMGDLTAILDGQISNILNFLAAAGALGTAAFGVVDATKALHGGVSNAGFRAIVRGLEPLLDGPTGTPVLGRRDVFATLYANWLNGVAKADQKAIAKSLIRLGLTPERAPRLATQTGVDPDALGALARDLKLGHRLSEEQMNLLGRFDAVVSAVLDEAYERADQQYRNWSKLWAMIVSTLLAIAGGAVIHAANAKAAAAAHAVGPGGAACGTEPTALCGYLFSTGFSLAAFVGVIATPLAPIAKDLSSALGAAVKAVGSVRR